MNRTILALLLFGLALSILHAPNFMLHLGIIAGLLTMTVKLFWFLLSPSAHAKARNRFRRAY